MKQNIELIMKLLLYMYTMSENYQNLKLTFVNVSPCETDPFSTK